MRFVFFNLVVMASLAYLVAGGNPSPLAGLLPGEPSAPPRAGTDQDSRPPPRPVAETQAVSTHEAASPASDNQPEGPTRTAPTPEEPVPGLSQGDRTAGGQARAEQVPREAAPTPAGPFALADTGLTVGAPTVAAPTGPYPTVPPQTMPSEPIASASVPSPPVLAEGRSLMSVLDRQVALSRMIQDMEGMYLDRLGN